MGTPRRSAAARRPATVALCLLASGLAACGSPEAKPSAALPETVPAFACGALEVQTSAGCERVGVRTCGSGFASDGDAGCKPVLPAAACGPAELATPGDTSCRAIGVRACAPGFFADAPGSCAPTLPALPCAEGTMATPGETVCAPVDACGDLPSGDLYVDASASAAGADGTKGKPFVTIGAAIAKAAAGATISVADGVYAEGVFAPRSVRIVGRCAAKVSILARLDAAVWGAADLELRDVTVGGSVFGVRVDSGTAVVANVRVLDTGDAGVVVNGTAHATLDHVLVERPRGAGIAIIAAGAKADVKRSVVRGVRAGKTGSGLVLQSGAASVERSVFEANEDAGIRVQDGLLTVDGSVVRDTRSSPGGSIAGGISLNATSKSPRLLLRKSLVERNELVGLYAVSPKLAQAEVEDCVFRDQLPRSKDGVGGIGLAIADVGSSLKLSHSLVERSRGYGLDAMGGSLEVEATVVRDVTLDPKGNYFGVGVHSGANETVGSPATVRLTDVKVERTQAAGIALYAANAALDGVVVADVAPHATKKTDGYGLWVARLTDGRLPGSLSMKRSLVERVRGIGVSLQGVPSSLESVVVRDVDVQASDGSDGLGVAVLKHPAVEGVQTLSLRGVLVENVHAVGVYLDDADATIEHTVVRSVKVSPSAGGGFALTARSATSAPIHTRVVESLFERTDSYGIVLWGGAAELTRLLARDTGNAAYAMNRGGSFVGSLLRADRARRTAFSFETSDVLLEDFAAFDVQADAAGAFGDGISVVGPMSSRKAIFRRGRVERAVRAGLASFGGNVELEDMMLLCTAFPVALESQAALTTAGTNVCGCTPKPQECRAVSASLSASPPPDEYGR